MFREEPARRQPLFASSRNVDWVEYAKETSTTLVSTWELFKLVRTIQAGASTKEEGRELLKRPGLVSIATND